MDKGHCHGQPGIDIRLLRRDPAEVIEPWQTDMLDDEIELGEISGSVIDVMDIESDGAQRVYGRSLGDMDVFDPRRLRQLQILVGPGIIETPSARAVAPFRR